MRAEDLLRQLKFTEYEIKCYLSLANLKEAGVGEIAKYSGVPRNKVYEVVQNLERSGFLMELSTKPKKFKILSLEKLKEIIREEKEKFVVLEKETEKIIEQLNKASVKKSKDLVWIINGQRNIMQKIAFETADSKKEILACTRSSIDYWTSFRNTKQAISGGVRVKFIGSFNEKNNKIVKRWLSAGAEYRIYDEKKFGPQGIRFGTFDDKSCRLTIGKPDVQKPEDYITIWSESPSFVNLLKRQFYFMWEQCKPPKI